MNVIFLPANSCILVTAATQLGGISCLQLFFRPNIPPGGGVLLCRLLPTGGHETSGGCRQAAVLWTLASIRNATIHLVSTHPSLTMSSIAPRPALNWSLMHSGTSSTFEHQMLMRDSMHQVTVDLEAIVHLIRAIRRKFKECVETVWDRPRLVVRILRNRFELMLAKQSSHGGQR